jgi:hypothetical protein
MGKRGTQGEARSRQPSLSPKAPTHFRNRPIPEVRGIPPDTGPGRLGRAFGWWPMPEFGTGLRMSTYSAGTVTRPIS